MEAQTFFKKWRNIEGEEYGYCALLSTPLTNEFTYCEGGDCRKCVIPLYAAFKS